jgi:transposase
MQIEELQELSHEELIAIIIRLNTEFANLKRLIFGQKRERFIPNNNTNQLAFFKPNPKENVQVQTEHISFTRKKRKGNQTPHSRNPLPSHLPRNEITIEPEEDISSMKKIGEEITEELEYKPGKLYVNRYIRPKYAKPNDEGVVIGTLPSRPIDKGIAGPGLLAHILVSKYIDHLPIHRQQKQFKRLDVLIPSSTLYGWVKSCADLLFPLYEVQKAKVLKSNYLMVDETTIRIHDGVDPGKCHTGYYWVYYDPIRRVVFFEYRYGRSRDGPNEVLKDFKGYIQTDGYSAYNDINRHSSITGLGCMSHARRRFVEAKEVDPKNAEWMLLHLQKLYAIERKAREQKFSHDDRYQLHQQHALPVLKEIKDWLDEKSLKILPKSVMGGAISYMLNQWSRLNVYVTDGRLEIDNNLVENAIRPIALGRKNYLFTGSHKSAKREASIYTIVSNAKLQGLEPFAYLRDVLNRISDYPHKQIADLLPCNWKNISEK